MSPMAIQERIESKLRDSLAPTFLDVINESGKHNVAPGSETHFKVIVVAPTLSVLTAVERHQRIYGLLAAELADGVHALSIKAYSPDEWARTEPGSVGASPDCMGGTGHQT